MPGRDRRRDKRARTGTTPGNNTRFPGYDVLGQADTWDHVTKGAVLSRLVPPQPVGFFDTTEEATCRALTDRLLAQDEEPRIPIVEIINSRLANEEFDGWRYEDMPPDDVAWRKSLAYLEEDARSRFGKSFAELEHGRQNDLIASVRAAGEWHGLDGERVWNLWGRYVLPAFYSHPWAWNEIGFGGPAYPRGYKNRGVGILEPWEKPEEHPRDPVPWGERIESVKKGHS